MARGWESKAVEAQQEQAERRMAGKAKGPLLDPARVGRFQVLQVARARVLADLAHAQAPARRVMLEQALADLDRAIAELAATPS